MPTIQTTGKTVSASLAQEFVNAICNNYNYQDTIDGQPNPQTKAKFAQEKLDHYAYTWAKNELRSYRRSQVSVDESVPELD